MQNYLKKYFILELKLLNFFFFAKAYIVQYMQDFTDCESMMLSKSMF